MPSTVSLALPSLLHQSCKEKEGMSEIIREYLSHPEAITLGILGSAAYWAQLAYMNTRAPPDWNDVRARVSFAVSVVIGQMMLLRHVLLT